jgi:hypothetical protein
MPASYPDFLPPDIDVGQIVACFGILSDTHMPQRCWADEQPFITRLDLLQMLDELDAEGRIASGDSAALRATLAR